LNKQLDSDLIQQKKKDDTLNKDKDNETNIVDNSLFFTINPNTSNNNNNNNNNNNIKLNKNKNKKYQALD